VIASDQAKYELGSTGEYTQGSGAVAFLITEDPDLLEISDTWGVATKGVGDFFKPRRTYNKIDLFKEASRLLSKEVDDEMLLETLDNSNSKFWSDSNSKVEVFKEEPIFEGQFSNECYQERILDALNHYDNQEETDFFASSQHLIFHLPYAFHGRRMIFKKWLSWITKNGEKDQLDKEVGIRSDEKLFIKKASKSKLYLDFVKNKIMPGEIASSEIGNMYSASIFMSLLSLLSNAFKNQIEITDNKVGFISYGSGSKSKVFMGIVQSGWKEQIKGLKLFEILESRKKIKIETYEKLHKNQFLNPLTSDKNVVKLSKIESGEFNLGLRRYKYNQK
jgi:hydroxymethylglutaryl-CoA synthase